MEEYKIGDKSMIPDIPILLKKSFSLYPKFAAKFVALILLPLAAIALIIAVALLFGLETVFFAKAAASTANIVLLALVGAALLALLFYIVLLSRIATFKLLIETASGNNVSIGWCLANSRNFVVVFLATSIISSVLIFAGLVLAIIPGIIAMIALYFVPWMILIEKKGAVESIKASFGIFMKNAKPVIFRLMPIILIEALLTIPLFILQKGTPSYEAMNAAITILSLFLAPLEAAYGYYLYIGIKR